MLVCLSKYLSECLSICLSVYHIPEAGVELSWLYAVIWPYSTYTTCHDALQNTCQQDVSVDHRSNIWLCCWGGGKGGGDVRSVCSNYFSSKFGHKFGCHSLTMKLLLDKQCPAFISRWHDHSWSLLWTQHLCLSGVIHCAVAPSYTNHCMILRRVVRWRTKKSTKTTSISAWAIRLGVTLKTSSSGCSTRTSQLHSTVSLS